MSIHSNLINLVHPQPGKMRQVSSQGCQGPPAIAAAIGPVDLGKNVVLEPGVTHTVADIPGQGPAGGLVPALARERRTD
jgi:hypothetical protein